MTTILISNIIISELLSQGLISSSDVVIIPQRVSEWGMVVDVIDRATGERTTVNLNV